MRQKPASRSKIIVVGVLWLLVFYALGSWLDQNATVLNAFAKDTIIAGLMLGLIAGHLFGGKLWSLLSFLYGKLTFRSNVKDQNRN